MPIEVRLMIRNMIKEAVLQYLLRKYIADLINCHGGLPVIEANNEEPSRAIVRIVAIKKEK